MNHTEELHLRHIAQKDKYELYFTTVTATTNYEFDQQYYIENMWPFYNSVTPNISDYIRVTFYDLMKPYDARTPEGWIVNGASTPRVAGLNMPFGPNTPDVYPVGLVCSRMRVVFFQGSATSRQLFWRMRPLTDLEKSYYA